ncbi:MAG TPA: hypothetical protein VMF57_13345 [Solirubrobacteraceae bacterium]|nr:hypothetical protein [Solirubrobacteraceae bacterium]
MALLAPPPAAADADVVVEELLALALPLEPLLALPQAAITQPKANATIMNSAPRGALRMTFKPLVLS